MRLCNVTARCRQLGDSTGQKCLPKLAVKLNFATFYGFYILLYNQSFTECQSLL